MKILNLILFFLTSSFLVMGQGIKGVVIDETTKKPIEYAHVIINKNEKPIKEAMTGKNGFFIITGLSEGEYQLQIRSLGYDPYFNSRIVVGNTVKDLNVISMRTL